MKPDVVKLCTVCESGNLNVFDHDAVGGHMPIWWCEDCGSLHIGSNSGDPIRTWQPEHSMLNRQVLAFHKRFGQAIGEKPHVPDEKTMRFRLSLIAEEFCELLEASTNATMGCRIDEVREAVKAALEYPLEVDLPAFIDATLDLDYVVEGCRITMGVNGTPIAAEVQRANMAKLPSYVAAKDAMHRGEESDEIETDIVPIKRGDGKILKPPGWTPPNIERELTLQGWPGEGHRCRYCGNPECHEGCRT